MKNRLYPVKNEKLYGKLIENGFEEIKPDSMYRTGSTILFNYGKEIFPVNIHVFELTKELKDFLSNMKPLLEIEFTISNHIDSLKNNPKKENSKSEVKNESILFDNMLDDIVGNPASFMTRYYHRKFHL